jgi:hypothetical protein
MILNIHFQPKTIKHTQKQECVTYTQEQEPANRPRVALSVSIANEDFKAIVINMLRELKDNIMTMHQH